jgi:hypothetical protein
MTLAKPTAAWATDTRFGFTTDGELVCNFHSEAPWCDCRNSVVSNREDGRYLRERLAYESLGGLYVPIAPALDFFQQVDVVERMMGERIMLQTSMPVADPVRKRCPYIFSDCSLGFFDPDEGLLTLRGMILGFVTEAAMAMGIENLVCHADSRIHARNRSKFGEFLGDTYVFHTNIDAQKALATRAMTRLVTTGICVFCEQAMAGAAILGQDPNVTGLDQL